MSLTKKQVKYYKPLILAKLAEMGVKNEVGYTQLKSTRIAPQVVQLEAGGYKIENKRVPNYRAANLYKSLTKKLLKMSPEGVDRFLNSVLPKPKPAKSEEVLIENEVQNEQESTPKA